MSEGKSISNRGETSFHFLKMKYEMSKGKSISNTGTKQDSILKYMTYL
jgi:hypothetical protein